MPDYSSPLYWQERYAHDPTSIFDWYLTYDELRPFVGPVLAARRSGDTEIFIPGCGNSTLGARLYADGYTNISNTDISSVVVSQAKDRYADMTEMDFCVLDACDMKEELPEPCFDVIIDKALTDSVLCGEDGFGKASSLIKEMHRVLRPGGVFIMVSHAAPSARTPYLASKGLSWAVDVIDIPKPKLDNFKEQPGASDVYYMYACTKARL